MSILIADFNKFAGCGCNCFLGNVIEAAGQNLIKRRKFIQLAAGTSIL